MSLELDFAEGALRIKEQIDGWVARHREHCVDDGCVEPLGLMAWLLHCYGAHAEGEKMTVLLMMLREYERDCPACQQGKH